MDTVGEASRHQARLTERFPGIRYLGTATHKLASTFRKARVSRFGKYIKIIIVLQVHRVSQSGFSVPHRECSQHRGKGAAHRQLKF